MLTEKSQTSVLVKHGPDNCLARIVLFVIGSMVNMMYECEVPGEVAEAWYCRDGVVLFLLVVLLGLVLNCLFAVI